MKEKYLDDNKLTNKKFKDGPWEARTLDLGVAVGPEALVYQHRALPTELTDHRLNKDWFFAK